MHDQKVVTEQCAVRKQNIGVVMRANGAQRLTNTQGPN